MTAVEYAVVVQFNPRSNKYEASVPDLPGWLAAGTDPVAVFAQAWDMLTTRLAALPTPPPVTRLRSLAQLQDVILTYRRRRNWPSATDLSRTSLGLLEESGQFEQARRLTNRTKMLEALGSVMTYCLGACAILGVSAHALVDRAVMQQQHRPRQRTH
jgi:predicted RNase H-like HicB family nuclease/NTP pyrophosphatase (non-canonical NTP hydrolase)